ncbi:MAG: hypothetical protein JNJ61_02795 [Anaerolineae bacterium]|nr:hypothetical protein [Anaerolineae bacterium]
MASKRRKQFKFWLYQDEDRGMIERIEREKGARRFSRAIRDGLRLFWSLERGDLSVLFELFPHLRHQFTPGGGELIEQFQRMMMAQPTPAAAAPPPQLSGFKPMNVPKLVAPALDDDDLVVVKRVETSEDDARQITENFMRSMSLLG